MDAHRSDALLPSLSIVPSRRGLLSLLVSAALGSTLTADAKKGGKGKKKKLKVCHHGETITIRKSAKASHLSHGDTAGACPPPIDVGCPGPADIAATSFDTIRQFSQTFLSPRSGVLTAAECDVRGFAEGADFTLEIRPLDPLTALPADSVLASALLPNQPETGMEPLLLAASFDPPAPVQEEDGYALVVTMSGVEDDFQLMARGGAPCPGRLFVTNNAGDFQQIAAGMIFSATIV